MTTSFASDFRRFFSRGLAAILPTLLTVALIAWLITTVQKYVGRPVRWMSQALVTRVWDIPADQLDRIWATYRLDILSFAIAIVVVYFVGRFVASFLGRAAWRSLERFLARIPLIKQIYPSIKQVTDFIILSDTKVRFSRVVAVEYPRKGIWSLGLVTSPGMRSLAAASGAEMLTLFIPSSPTPVTGYTITVRRDEVIDLPFDIDQAFRFTVSGGVILPPSEVVSYDAEDAKPQTSDKRLPTAEVAT